MKANKNELLQLITDLNPAVICLQETFLKHNNKINIREYQQFNYIKDTGLQASGGTSILVRNDIPQSQIHLKTDLQTIAVKATLQTYYICSVYIPPNEEINENKLQKIIKQLPAPFIILGDFNCHSTLWGCKNTNQKGKNLETFINNNNLCIYNNKSLTYLCPFSGSYSAIDLSLSDPSIFMDDTYGSDHFPICLQNLELSDENPKRWNLNKANWEKFQIYAQ